MLEIVQSETYRRWFARLRDPVVRTRILVRIRRLSVGNPGQHRVLTHGVVELKIDVGPGFRVYCLRRGDTVAVLPCGGDKSTQQDDIRTAIRIACEWSGA